MSVTVSPPGPQNTIELELSGKLNSEDYDRFVPVIEDTIERHGKLRLLVAMHDFHGWDAKALWEDTKFDARHFSDIERLAFVGEKGWQKGMAWFCRPFTSAQIRYFEEHELEQARAWLHDGSA